MISNVIIRTDNVCNFRDYCENERLNCESRRNSLDTRAKDKRDRRDYTYHRTVIFVELREVTKPFIGTANATKRHGLLVRELKLNDVIAFERYSNRDRDRPLLKRFFVSRRKKKYETRDGANDTRITGECQEKTENVQISDRLNGKEDKSVAAVMKMAKSTSPLINGSSFYSWNPPLRTSGISSSITPRDPFPSFLLYAYPRWNYIQVIYRIYSECG